MPPTDSTSVILSCSNGTTRAVANAVDDMGRLRDVAKAVLPRGGRPHARRRSGFVWAVADGGHGAWRCGAIAGNSKDFFPIIDRTTPGRTAAPARHAPPHRVLCLGRHRHHGRDLRQLDPGAVPVAARAMCAGPSSTAWTRPGRCCARSTTPAEREGKQAIVFITLVNDEIRQVLTHDECKGLVLDMFSTFVEPLEVGVRRQVQPPHRPLLRRRQERGVPRPHRGHQLLAGPRRRPVRAQPGQRRRDPGRRQPQRQDADLAVPGDAARHQGRQLPADPGGLRARPAALQPGAVQDASASA